MSKIIYLLFFLSGLAGLIYEIIWGRQFVLVFGSTTNSIVAVVSAFLGGLALGSLLSGKIADRLSPFILIKSYALLEFGVGVFGLLTLILLPGARAVYWNFSDGTSVTLSLLIIKFIFATLIILIPTTLMGATLPLLVKFLQSVQKVPEKTVSLLYSINTFGGALGVILSAFVLIEIFGLNSSIMIAALINFVIALIANQIKVRLAVVESKITQDNRGFLELLSPQKILILISFMLSGLISIAYQILWTRALTPSLGTVIYAFASILTVYLIGIALGSLIYNRFNNLIRNKLLAFAVLEFGIGFLAFLSVMIMHKFELQRNLELLIVILPATILMGLTFPAVIAIIAETKALGKLIGLSYFSNTIGAILGGFIASFLLVPILGTSAAIVFLATINFLIALLIVIKDPKISGLVKPSLVGFLGICLIGTLGIIVFKSDRLYPKKLDFLITEAKIKGYPYKFYEDEVATVFGFSNPEQKQEGLVIDGVTTTHRVSETRLMAHIPLSLVEKPKDVLIIAFGMGSTFRSSLKQGMNTDAVELVPSVPKNMELFYDDAGFVQNNPLGRIIINDGRNYAYLSRKKYDVVIIDPPPPFNTAGSTVLHSTGFYQDLSKILNKGGIVNQWIYYYRSREDEVSMAIKSFTVVFPYILAIEKTDSVGGLYLLGSYRPIDLTRLTHLLENPIVVEDLKEVMKENYEPNVQKLVQVVGNRDSLLKVVGNFPAITDDRPRSEYYLWRYANNDFPFLVTDDAKKFINKIKSNY